MNPERTLWVMAAIQAVVTLMLLGFAYLMRDDSPELANVVVGAAVLHWFNQSTYLGRQVHEQIRRNGHGT